MTSSSATFQSESAIEDGRWQQYLAVLDVMAEFPDDRGQAERLTDPEFVSAIAASYAMDVWSQALRDRVHGR